MRPLAALAVGSHNLTLVCVMQKIRIVLVIASLMLTVGGTALVYYTLIRPMVYCESRVDQLVAGPSNYDVKVVETGCNGIAGSDTMSVMLSSKSDRKDIVIFEYGRQNADPSINRDDVGPTIKWDGNSIHISIDMVSYIKKQLKEVGGINISYEIGAVVYK
jgi:hypothetical protein